MPLTLITGIFGMNFEFIPGLHSRGGFWISLAAMAGVVVAMLLYFRFRRWL
jgi:magnesium transporter